MVKHIEVGFKKLSEHATIPTKAHETDSGFDLYAAEDVIIAPGETVVVKTDIALVLPEGYGAQVRPRSGITSKTKLRVQLGTIDNAYRGPVGIIVDNIAQKQYYVDAGDLFIETALRPITINNTVNEQKLSLYPSYECGTYIIKKGDKLAQLVIQHLPKIQTYNVDDLGVTDRGGNGFGSSGV